MLILRLITLQHLIIGCLTCYVHSLLCVYIRAYILTLDSIGELTGNMVRVFIIPYISHVKCRQRLKYLYQIATCIFSLANVVFVYAMMTGSPTLIVCSWMVNRWSSHIISAFRDAFLYSVLVRKPQTNVPLLKAIKSVGILLTIIQVNYISSPAANRMIIVGMALLVSVLGYIVSIHIDTSDFTVKNTKEDGIFIFSNALKIILFSSLLFIIPSDQMIFSLAPRHRGVIYKFLGQTVCGIIYALIFKNRIMGPLLNQLLAASVYGLTMIDHAGAGAVCCTLLGLGATISQSAYTIIPHYIASNKHSAYQSITIVAIDGARLLCSLLLEVVQKYTIQIAKFKIYMMTINLTLFGLLFSYMLFNNAKSKKKKQQSITNTNNLK